MQVKAMNKWYAFNFLIPNCDEHQISPYNITCELKI